MKKTSALLAVLPLLILSLLTPTPVIAGKNGYPPTPAWIKKALLKGERCRKYEDDFVRFGLPPEIFSYVAFRESRCAITAVNARFDRNGKITYTLNANGTYDSGLLQINSGWKTVTAQSCQSRFGDLKVLLTLDCNLKVARHLFQNGGFKHWSLKIPTKS